MANRLFEGGDCSDEETGGDLHIVKIGAHQIEDIGRCLEAGFNFVVESIEWSGLQPARFCLDERFAA